MLIRDASNERRWIEGKAREQALARNQRLLNEEIESNTITVKDDAGFDTSDILAQMGRPLTCQQVIEKLKLCNSRLVFERSISCPELYGVYLLSGGKKTHICGMEAGVMPEFSVIHKKTKRVPDPDAIGKDTGRELQWKTIETFADETRGWRTVLLRLLRAGIIQKVDIERNFGWTPSRTSENWHLKTS